MREALWVSLGLGVIALDTIGFVGIFAWLLWIGLAAIAMLRWQRPQTSIVSNSS